MFSRRGFGATEEPLTGQSTRRRWGRGPSVEREPETGRGVALLRPSRDMTSRWRRLATWKARAPGLEKYGSEGEGRCAADRRARFRQLRERDRQREPIVRRSQEDGLKPMWERSRGSRAAGAFRQRQVLDTSSQRHELHAVQQLRSCGPASAADLGSEGQRQGPRAVDVDNGVRVSRTAVMRAATRCVFESRQTAPHCHQRRSTSKDPERRFVSLQGGEPFSRPSSQGSESGDAGSAQRRRTTCLNQLRYWGQLRFPEPKPTGRSAIVPLSRASTSTAGIFHGGVAVERSRCAGP